MIQIKTSSISGTSFFAGFIIIIAIIALSIISINISRKIDALEEINREFNENFESIEEEFERLDQNDLILVGRDTTITNWVIDIFQSQ